MGTNLINVVQRRTLRAGLDVRDRGPFHAEHFAELGLGQAFVGFRGTDGLDALSDCLVKQTGVDVHVFPLERARHSTLAPKIVHFSDSLNFH